MSNKSRTSHTMCLSTTRKAWLGTDHVPEMSTYGDKFLHSWHTAVISRQSCSDEKQVHQVVKAPAYIHDMHMAMHTYIALKKVLTIKHMDSR